MNEIRISQIRYQLREINDHGLGDSATEATRMSLEVELSRLLSVDEWWYAKSENDKEMLYNKYFPRIKKRSDHMIKLMYEFEMRPSKKVI